jgi:hypothetical protein
MVLMSALGCSTVPDWSPRESRELEVTVHYSAAAGARTVSLPTSTEDLLILSLEPSPDRLRETFSGSGRGLILPEGEAATVRCRYRLFRSRAEDGTPLPWTPARELFPGARRIVRRPAADSSQIHPQGVPQDLPQGRP